MITVPSTIVQRIIKFINKKHPQRYVYAGYLFPLAILSCVTNTRVAFRKAVIVLHIFNKIAKNVKTSTRNTRLLSWWKLRETCSHLQGDAYRSVLFSPEYSEAAFVIVFLTCAHAVGKRVTCFPFHKTLVVGTIYIVCTMYNAVTNPELRPSLLTCLVYSKDTVKWSAFYEGEFYFYLCLWKLILYLIGWGFRFQNSTNKMQLVVRLILISCVFHLNAF